MTTIALISDIHGNAVALDAVLADIDDHDVDHVVCLGDIAACGPEPETVIARLSELGCPCVAGNTDEWLLGRLLPEPHERDYGPLMALIEWGASTISAGARRFLAGLPARRELEIGGARLLCFHGSPRSLREGILAETPEQTLRELVRQSSVSLYAGGHTHLQLVRRFDSALFVNPGSVGVALADAPSSTPLPVAHYALVTVADGVDAVMRPVEVDASAAAARAQASGMPRGNEWADILARRVTRSNERARARALAGARPTGEDARR